MAYPANTARCVFQFGLPNGTNGYVTPHTRKSDGSDYTALEVAGLADVLEDWAVNDNFEGNTNTALMNLVSDQCTLQSITVTGLAAATPPQTILAVNNQGNQPNAALPNETSLVVTLYTGIVGRSYRGRNFWPGLGVDAMEDNGTLSATALANFQDLFTALVVGLESATSSELAVNSTSLGLSSFVTSALVRDVLHHQRRRNS